MLSTMKHQNVLGGGGGSLISGPTKDVIISLPLDLGQMMMHQLRFGCLNHSFEVMTKTHHLNKITGASNPGSPAFPSPQTMTSEAQSLTLHP